MSQCVREGIIKEIKATGKSYKITPDATEIFIPITSYRDRATTYNIAKRLHDKATAIFGKFGKNTSLNTTYSDGVAVNIHPTPQLIRAYDIKNSKDRERKEEEEARKSVWDREGSLGIDEFGDSNPLYQLSVDDDETPSVQGKQFQKLTAEEKAKTKQLISDNNITSNNQIQEAKSKLKQILPQIPVEIVNDYIQVVYNSDAKAIGKFENGLITLSKKSNNITSTAFHEAFHAVMDILKTTNPKLYEKTLDEASKRYGIKRGESKASVKYSVEQQNQINYILKSIDILQSQKAIDWFKKRDKGQWEGDLFYSKLQQDLQISKEQIDLIKSLSLNNQYNREEILSSLLANYSYTVEINTAKEKSGTTTKINFEENPFLDEEDFQTDGGGNTKYYSNLTVPGGTNYTENEISTPLITPSIKGHAQFATDNGIGWFRSDVQLKKANTPSDKLSPYANGLKPSNTRRILEVQSDLFQKGRDRDRLITVMDIKSKIDEINNLDLSEKALEKITSEGRIAAQVNDVLNPDLTYRGKKIKSLGYYNNTFQFQWGDYGNNGIEKINKQEYLDLVEKERIYLEASLEKEEVKLKQNQFLQLLNKDNNWVTFFVKSIIQDSAKKGYEKVIFPTGNTASKVEGHTTLEEFKKEKEDRLKALEKDESSYKTKYSNILEEWVIERNGIEIPYPTYKNQEDANKELERIHTRNQVEIKQLKQELERVEGPEGFGALKPIYNFYENTVANIIKKQGYSPKLITDEYGNTWNEIDLSTLPKELFDNIKLSSPNIQYEGDLAIEEKLAEDFQKDTSINIAGTFFEKLMQWINNMIDLIKNKPVIDRLFRDIRQGKYRESYKNNINGQPLIPNDFDNESIPEKTC